MKQAITKALQPVNKLLSFDSLVPVAILSMVAWYISHMNGLVTAYNDSMSHVNIARLVIDNQEPGLAQLGSVWLPLNHILPLLLVWNEWAWQSAFAGSFFSMVSFVVAVGAIYKTVLIVTKKTLAAIIGALAFAFNLNMLYVQTTPLTESLYIALFSLSVLVFTLWLTKKDNAKYLLVLGVLGFFQVVARYDGWFVVAIQGLLIALHELAIVRRTFQETLGKLFLYGLPVVMGILLWFVYNAVIFGSPLYFIFGEHSAHAQQQVIEKNAGLLAKGNIVNSILAYGYAMLHNVGTYVIGAALAGIAVLFFKWKDKLTASRKGLLVALLASPIVFNVIALFLGFSVINIPEMNPNPVSPEGQWFNVRYGLLALPFAAVLLGIFASWRKLAAVIAIQLIVLQAMTTYNNGIITIVDGTAGSSAYRNHAVAEKLGASVSSDEHVLMSVSVFNPVAFDSGLDLKQFVHEGVSKKWNEALHHPEKHAEWIVMSSDPNRGDPVRNALVNDRNNAFLTQYDIVYTDSEATIYRLKGDDRLSLTGGEK
jgi:hypothetical protein